MKVIAYKNLCKQNKKNRVHIYCTKKVFKPLAFSMGALILMFVLNLAVGNFFQNVRTSLQHFVNSFVNIFVL
ncbi:MAG TPA: hypothetical protein DCO89_00740 [Clostridiales bacterium]|nr:hypothetical protein [Clostridiales bacterium]